MRLIDADAIPWDVEGVGFIPVIGKDEIDEMPTVDVEPVRHGRWYSVENYMDTPLTIYVCSECGHANWIKEDNYCQFCGAKMDEVEDEPEKGNP